MRFEQCLRDSAVRFPDKTALVASGKRLTFSQLDDLSDELAQGLLNRGIARGDRVVLFLDNSVEAVVSIFAVLKAGAVFSPVNPRPKPTSSPSFSTIAGRVASSRSRRSPALPPTRWRLSPSVAVRHRRWRGGAQRFCALERGAQRPEVRAAQWSVRHRHRWRCSSTLRGRPAFPRA